MKTIDTPPSPPKLSLFNVNDLFGQREEGDGVKRERKKEKKRKKIE